MLRNKDQIDNIEWHARYINSRGQGGIEREIDTLRTILFQVLDELTLEQRKCILEKIGEA